MQSNNNSSTSVMTYAATVATPTATTSGNSPQLQHQQQPPTTNSTSNCYTSSNGCNQQQQQQQQKNPKLYKTELCRSWMEHGRCNYGERCQYAHGEREKRPVPRHPKYKTEACQSFHKTGLCPYGPRCHFIHNESQAQLSVLIEQNEKALRMVQELASFQINGSPCLDNGARKSLIGASSSSNSLVQQPTHLQKNHSMHAFPNGNSFHNSLFLGKAQSFSSSPHNEHAFHQQQQQQFNGFGPFRQQHPISLSMLGSSTTATAAGGGYQREFCAHQNLNFWFASHQCSPEHSSSLFEQVNDGGVMCSPNNYHQKHQRPTGLFPHYHHHPLNRQQLNQQDSSSHSASHPQSPLMMVTTTSSFALSTPNNGDQRSHMSFSDAVTRGEHVMMDHHNHHHHQRDISNSEQLLDPIHQMLGNLCSSDDEYSRSSLVSSTADSGTESPLLPIFDNDTLTKSSRAISVDASGGTNPTSDGRMMHLINGGDQTDANAEEQQRRSSDPSDIGGGAAKAQVMSSNHHHKNSSTSTTSSSLASLLSSSSSSQAVAGRLLVAAAAAGDVHGDPPPHLAQQGTHRLPVFERLSLNQ